MTWEIWLGKTWVEATSLDAAERAARQLEEDCRDNHNGITYGERARIVGPMPNLTEVEV